MAKIRGKQKRKVRREAIRAAFRLAKRGEEITVDSLAEEIINAGALAKGDLAGFDWDAFLEFLEKLIPWIMKLIDLFT